MELINPTSLETATDVVATLNWKINSLMEQDKNVSNGLCDYFGIGLNNLDAQLEQLKQLEADIKERKKALTGQISHIKQDGARFLQEQGIDRLDGVLYSSLSVRKGAPATSKKKYKLLVSKRESEEFLVESGLAVYERVDVPETKDSLTIYNRKMPLVESA